MQNKNVIIDNIHFINFITHKYIAQSAGVVE